MPYRTRQPHQRYIEGDWLAVCDRCGFDHMASDLIEEWTGLRVCKSCYEPRHPQDFLTGHPDDPQVPWSRPDNNSNTSITVIGGDTLSTDVYRDLVGDENKTLRVDGTPRMNGLQEWGTTLTANRTVTLDTTDIQNFDTFTVTRSAGGAFTLDVGGLKTIPASTKATVVVQVRNSAWALESYTPFGL